MKYNILIEYNNEQYKVLTDEDITLKQLRDELVISGLDAESSKIYFNGKLLIGANKLSQYGIKDNDKLVIIPLKKNDIKSFVEFAKIKVEVEKTDSEKTNTKLEEKYIPKKEEKITPPNSDKDEEQKYDSSEDDSSEDENPKRPLNNVRFVPQPIKNDDDVELTLEQEEDLSKIMAVCNIELDEAKKTYLLCNKNLEFSINTLLDKK
jgi:uncharacterized ubiquitin-like protein YukD